MVVSDLTLLGVVTQGLDNSYTALQQVEAELASGKAVTEPSDNPVVFDEASLLTTSQSAISNDVSLATQLQDRLQAASGALGQAAQIMNSAISYATEGANGTLTAAQMANIAQAVQGQLNQLLAQANFQYAGEYLFGGDSVSSAPYNNAGVYSGSTLTNSVRFSSGVSLQTTFNGQAIFGDQTSGAIGALNSLIAALQSGNQTAVANTLPLLNAGLQQIAQAEAQIGEEANTASSISSDGNSTVTLLSEDIGNLVDTNVATASEQMALDNAEIQSLVGVASNLARIPLVNILA